MFFPVDETIKLLLVFHWLSLILTAVAGVIKAINDKYRIKIHNDGFIDVLFFTVLFQ